MIAIIDYDMANLRSVQKGFEHVGAEAAIVRRPEEIDGADKIVMPGVGAFADAMTTLRARGLIEPILRHIKRGKPFLGICLGLQLLVDIGYEDGRHQGLGVIAGKCVRFDVDRTRHLKVPHMGWNQLDLRHPAPFLAGLPSQPCVYFVHSYHVVPDDSALIATTTDYGGDFVSSIRRDNLMATQFHPEKSQKVGLQILANFAAL